MPAPTAAADRLVTDHLALVGHIARDAASKLPRHLDTDDLLGAGALALVQASQAFDSSLGVPFARFAAIRVRGAMIDQMRTRDWATRSVRSRSRALAGLVEELTTALHRRPTDAELAAASGMSQAEVREVLHGVERAGVLSLDPVGTDDEGLGASLQDRAPSPDETLVAAERMGYLRDAVAELPERLRMVVTGYYLQDRPLTELAAELGVTASRASQLRAEGLAMLQEALLTLLPEDGRAGPGASATASPPPPARPGGTAPPAPQDRRREAYVQAVASRSSVRGRADVQAYLDGGSMGTDRRAHHGLPGGPRQAVHPIGAGAWPQHPRTPADK